MNQSANFFRGFTREGCLATTLANLCRNVFYQGAMGTHYKHLADMLIFRGSIAADVAPKHDYLRFLFATHSAGSGS